MAELNSVGDVVLKDPRAMLALASPARLALLDVLHRHGPAAVEQLASLLGSDPEAIGEDLEALDEVGLVERRGMVAGRPISWAAVGKGVFFELPEDAEGQVAARRLSNAMLLHYVDVPKRWVVEKEPQLPFDWARAAGLLNVRLALTPEELVDIQEQLERLFEPFITREAASYAAEVADVRIMSFFLPEPSQQNHRDRRP
jgi:DNA-binding transcriptional ArsR family regulator